MFLKQPFPGFTLYVLWPFMPANHFNGDLCCIKTRIYEKFEKSTLSKSTCLL